VAEPIGLTEQWVIISAEIERTLQQSFRGTISLECPGDGTVRLVRFEDFWRPGKEEKRNYERQG